MPPSRHGHRHAPPHAIPRGFHGRLAPHSADEPGSSIQRRSSNRTDNHSRRQVTGRHPIQHGSNNRKANGAGPDQGRPHLTCMFAGSPASMLWRALNVEAELYDVAPPLRWSGAHPPGAMHGRRQYRTGSALDACRRSPSHEPRLRSDQLAMAPPSHTHAGSLAMTGTVAAGPNLPGVRPTPRPRPGPCARQRPRTRPHLRASDSGRTAPEPAPAAAHPLHIHCTIARELPGNRRSARALPQRPSGTDSLRFRRSEG